MTTGNSTIELLTCVLNPSTGGLVKAGTREFNPAGMAVHTTPFFVCTGAYPMTKCQ